MKTILMGVTILLVSLSFVLAADSGVTTAAGKDKPASAPTDVVVFDFENPADLKNWSNIDLNEAREAEAKTSSRPARARTQPALAKEPPVRIELSDKNATSGKSSLMLTYAGGKLPTVGADMTPAADWSGFQGFFVDVTASRPCVVVFRVLRERSSRGDSYQQATTRFEKVALLQAGKNQVSEFLEASDAKWGKVARFEITMYAPNEGESIYVDNIRLTTEPPKAVSPYCNRNLTWTGEIMREYKYFPALDKKIKVLGTDWEVASGNELGDKVKDKWVKPVQKSIDQIEQDFRAEYEVLKKTHPKAVLAIFRDGQKGFDQANPDKAYDGWRDCWLWGHDPGSVSATKLGSTPGKSEQSELFLRRRCPIMKVDLSSLPKGAEILNARLLLTRTSTPNPESAAKYPAWSPFKPTLFVAEPCNRPWMEEECNGVEYAKGKFWQEICGMYWCGEDPDFLPMFIAYGQSGFDVHEIDFTNAVKFWIDGKHPNYGFVLYSPSEYWDNGRIWCREASDIKKRPAMMVIYEPK